MGILQIYFPKVWITLYGVWDPSCASKADKAKEDRDASRQAEKEAKFKEQVWKRQAKDAEKEENKAKDEMYKSHGKLQDWTMWWENLECRLNEEGKSSAISWVKRLGRPHKRLMMYITG